jgi:carotenoid cleavage dioxygenase
VPTEKIDPDGFRILGTIEEEETGRPLAGLIVRAYDRDFLFDDKVGVATTDEDGRFEIRFSRRDFSDPGESQPDLYLRIYDRSGIREIHQTTDAIRWNASATERYRLRIPARALRPPGAR